MSFFAKVHHVPSTVKCAACHKPGTKDEPLLDVSISAADSSVDVRIVVAIHHACGVRQLNEGLRRK